MDLSVSTGAGTRQAGVIVAVWAAIERIFILPLRQAWSEVGASLVSVGLVQAVRAVLGLVQVLVGLITAALKTLESWVTSLAGLPQFLGDPRTHAMLAPFVGLPAAALYLAAYSSVDSNYFNAGASLALGALGGAWVTSRRILQDLPGTRTSLSARDSASAILQLYLSMARGSVLGLVVFLGAVAHSSLVPNPPAPVSLVVPKVVPPRSAASTAEAAAEKAAFAARAAISDAERAVSSASTAVTVAEGGASAASRAALAVEGATGSLSKAASAVSAAASAAKSAVSSGNAAVAAANAALSAAEAALPPQRKRDEKRNPKPDAVPTGASQPQWSTALATATLAPKQFDRAGISNTDWLSLFELLLYSFLAGLIERVLPNSIDRMARDAR